MTAMNHRFCWYNLFVNWYIIERVASRQSCKCSFKNDECCSIPYSSKCSAATYWITFIFIIYTPFSISLPTIMQIFLLSIINPCIQSWLLFPILELYTFWVKCILHSAGWSKELAVCRLEPEHMCTLWLDLYCILHSAFCMLTLC